MFPADRFRVAVFVEHIGAGDRCGPDFSYDLGIATTVNHGTFVVVNETHIPGIAAPEDTAIFNSYDTVFLDRGGATIGVRRNHRTAFQDH